MSILTSRFLLRASVLSLLMTSAAGVAHAQDGLLLRDLFGKIGIMPEEKDPIEYRERAPLVVPKDTGKLRAPEDTPVKARNSQWPVDPDVEERKRELARRNATRITHTSSDPSEGGRLSLQELARGRSQRGAVMGEAGSPLNDKTGVRMDPDQWSAQSQQALAPSYPPGTEPPRKFLTDPPVGLRRPSADAPMVRTQEAPLVTGKDGRPDSAWKRLD